MRLDRIRRMGVEYHLGGVRLRLPLPPIRLSHTQRGAVVRLTVRTRWTAIGFRFASLLVRPLGWLARALNVPFAVTVVEGD